MVLGEMIERGALGDLTDFMPQDDEATGRAPPLETGIPEEEPAMEIGEGRWRLFWL